MPETIMDGLSIIETWSLEESVKVRLLDLWNSEYPEKLSMPDLDALNNYLSKLDNLRYILLQDKDGKVHGWAWSFNRDGERWFAVIISTILQGKGLGREMIERLKINESVLNGWVTDHYQDIKQNGTIYQSPLDFYYKCGFIVLHNLRLETEKMSAVKIRWTKDRDTAIPGNIE